MTPNRATLLSLVQCRPLWFWHFWGAVISLVAIFIPMNASVGREGAIFTILVVPLWSSIVTASVAKDFFTRPLSFTIPGHAKTWRRTLYLVGLVVASVCALMFLIAQADSPETTVLMAWQTFFLCMAMYVAGTLAVMSLPTTGFLPAVITVILMIGINDGVAQHMRVTVERVLMASPSATTIVCVAIVAAGWFRLGSRKLARELCGEAFLPLHSSFNGARQSDYSTARKMRRMRRSHGTLVKTLEWIYLNSMRKLGNHSTLRSFFGTLYVQLGNAAPARLSHFAILGFALVTATVLMGFYSPGRLDNDISGANLVLFLVCMLNAEYRINAHTGMLLNIGRKDRFRSLMFSGLSQTLVVTAISAGLIAISLFAGRIIDDVTLYGVTYTYAPMSPKAFLIFAPMLPFLFLSQLVFPKQHIIVVIFIATVSTIGFMSFGHKLIAESWLFLLLMQVVYWVPLVAVARHQCYSQDLKLIGK